MRGKKEIGKREDQDRHRDRKINKQTVRKETEKAIFGAELN